MKETSDLILPPRLNRGDTIGLLAPSGPIVDEENFAAGVRLLRETGFEVKFAPDLTQHREEYLAGTDRRRANELHDLWADPEVKALLAARGGYGSLRIASSLDMDLMRSQPKILIGFSDVTVLITAILKHAGLVTFHGPTLSTLATSDRETVTTFFNTITGRPPEQIKAEGLEVLVPGQARGRLLGGNLTTLTYLMGTPYELSWEGTILFFEDVNEAPYRLDRALTHLKEADRLQGIAGVILGRFDDCGDVELFWKRAIEIFQDEHIPIWANFPVGHGQANRILPLGIEAEMDSGSGTLHFLSPCIM